jgi:hypothetical protein
MSLQRNMKNNQHFSAHPNKKQNDGIKKLLLTQNEQEAVGLILFPDKNAPRCAANFSFWLT